MDGLLKKASKHSDAAEVYCIKSEEIPVSFEANRLKHLETKRITGLALRVIKKGKIGLSASTAINNTEKDNLIKMAVESCEIGEKAKFHFPGAQTEIHTQPQPKIYDPSIVEIDANRLVDIGEDVIRIISNYDPNILCDVHLTREVGEVSITNSNGGGYTYKKTMLFGLLAATAIEGNDILTVYRGTGSCRNDLDLQDLAKDIIETLEISKKIVPTSTCQLPVLFTPRGISPILHALKAAFNGRAVFQGASPLTGKIGNKAFDSRISIYDDSTIDYAIQSSPIDEEGVITQKTPLIEKGEIKKFYYNLQTAGLAKTKSTGNGFRTTRSGHAFEGPPTPVPTNIIILPGDKDLSEIIANMDEGIIVDQTIGAGQGNILSGEFSFNVHLGFKVEKGKIIGRIKDTMVAGNALDALNDIDSISKQTQWVYGQYSSPWFLFRSLGVVTKS